MFSSSGHAAQLDYFREKNLTVSSHLARTYDQLEPYLNYDQIVIGSDQVWNPSDQYGPDPVYFGYPFSNRITTSSYAASFGSISRIESCVHNILPWIQSLQQCSVREGEARDFLNANNVDCVLVPDPTLLVDDLKAYMVFPSDIDLSSAIFVYALRTQDGVSDIVSLLSSHLGLTPISASTPWRRWKSIGKEIDLDPFTFLGSIAASKLVVSNSFHGIVCSVLLRKEFIAVSLPGSKAGLSSRIRSFLNAVGLEDRLISPTDLSHSLDLAEDRINWPLVQDKIIHLRSQGRNFIDNVTMMHLR